MTPPLPGEGHPEQVGQPATVAADVEPIERSVLDLVTGIKDGRVEPKTIRPADRRRCVAYLLGEGLSQVQIAQTLRCSEKTIERDKKQLQEDSALSHDPKLAARMAGALVRECEASIIRLRRLSRERDCPHDVRVDVERAIFEIGDGLANRLQSLGYLPTAAQRVEASLTHHAGPAQWDELDAEVARLQAIAVATAPTDCGQRAELHALADLTKRARIAASIHEIAATVDAGPPAAQAPEEDRDAPAR